MAAVVPGEKVDAVRLAGVRFRWPGARGFRLAVDALSVSRGERVLLLGPSGTGKSTLLNLICGISAPQAGTVHVLGYDLAGLSATGRDRFRAEHFGIIFQMFNLLPYASAVENVLLPLSFAPERRSRALNGRPSKAEAVELLSALGIDADHATHGDASSLSVGQQQRVAAARALIGAPEIVVADEPTSALDVRSQETFLDLLFGQLEKAGSTLIMVSHDERLASRFDRTIALQDIATSVAEGPA